MNNILSRYELEKSFLKSKVAQNQNRTKYVKSKSKLYVKLLFSYIMLPTVIKIAWWWITWNYFKMHLRKWYL